MNQNTHSAVPSRREPSPAGRRQLRFALIMLALLLVLLGGTWLVRYPQGYVNILLGHYVGTTSVLAGIDGFQATEEDQALLLPLQQSCDDWRQTHLGDTLTLTAPQDGLALSGTFYDAGSPVTVIGLHGFDGSRQEAYPYLSYYADQGFNLFLPDLRSHGDSEGFLVTWGACEGQDLLSWMDLLDEAYGPQTYILHGQDLGASAALWCAGDARVAFVTAESPVLDLYDGIRYLLTERFHFPGFLMPLVDWNARQLLPGGQSMKAFSLLDTLDGVSTPILLLSGGTDGLADPAAAAAFYEQYAGPKELIQDDGARRGMVYPRNQAETEAALDRYLEAYLPEAAS